MRTLFLIAFSLHVSAAFSQVTHAWLVPAPSFKKEAHFTNLTDGASIKTPFLLKFGLTGIGLAPIVKPVPRAGHHHLMINRELPMEMNKPLPFNDQYIHFGKGGMETVLNLPPGEYKLRLVLADDKHIPNFVYSKPISVTVSAQSKDVDPKSLIVKGVSILSPKDGASVSAPFRIVFHASGLNVSNVAIADESVGHFRLRLNSQGSPEQVIAFTNGYTEAWLQPPAGKYEAKLEFVNNKNRDEVMAFSGAVVFTVTR